MRPRYAVIPKTDHFPVEDLVSDYVPSLQAHRFHLHPARFRYLIWGIKSGKTVAGAQEFLRCALAMPGALNWIVAPTYKHVKVAEREILGLLRLWTGMTTRRHRALHEINLKHGGLIELNSAENEDHLRGPNIDGVIWIDEGSHMRASAWWILLERIAATRAEVIVTTTPKGRDWVFDECQLAGLPGEAPHGEFESPDGDRFVSHFETSDFPWVDHEEIESARIRMPAQVYDQEYKALFVSNASQVFQNVDAAISWEEVPKKITGATIMGVDLARHQDFSAVVTMNNQGRVLYVNRWADTAWSIQMSRINRLAREQNAIIILDRSNVGSKVYEDLRAEGLNVEPIDMNSPQVKMDLIQTLQVAFEREQVKIPSPRAAWTMNKIEVEQLIKELKWYEYTVTKSAKGFSYAAPRGSNDDLCIAMALANWGRIRHFAGGIAPAEVLIPRSEWDNRRIRLGHNGEVRLKRPRVFGSVYNRSKLFGSGESDGPLWG